MSDENGSGGAGRGGAAAVPESHCSGETGIMSDEQQGQGPASGAARQKVIEVIDEVRPYIQRDGGDIEFVDFTDDGTVKVRLRGACVGCPGARMTLAFGVEARLRKQIPEVRGVECVD